MRRMIAGIMAVAMVFTLIPSASVSADDSKQILTSELLSDSDIEDNSSNNETENSIRVEGEKALALAGDAAANQEYHDGKYTASAEGYHGTDIGSTGAQITVAETVKVTVTIANKKITAIDVDFIGNDGMMAPPFKQMASKIIDNIIAAQTTEGVDTISQATSTSKGIKGAVKLALEKAKEGSPFEDGTYVTDSVIWKTDQDTESMAASVLEPLTVFEVKGGKPTVTFLFKETIIATMQSYITDLGYFKSREDLEAYRKGDESKLVKGQVVEKMKIQTERGEVEAPKRIQFAFDNFNEIQYIFLFSNVMSNDARFKISYDKATSYKGVESVQVSDPEILLNEEQSVKVSAKALPEDATDTGIVWSSLDESIATVDENGMITALKAGNVEVRATAKNGVYASVKVQIKTAALDFQKTGNTTVALTGASDDTTYLKIPEKAKIDGKEYTVTSVGENAFKNNKKIRTLILPETVTEIGSHAFDGTSLQNLIFADSIEKVGAYAFSNITTLEKANLSTGLKELGEGAFQNDTSLKSINIPEALKKISQQTFQNCSSLSEITIPSSVQIIEAEAFAGCRSLTGVVLNEGLERIEEKAFHLNSSLNNLVIPASVKSIGKQGFARNTSLSHIEIKGEQLTFGSQALVSHGDEAQILVPRGTVKVYQNSLKEAGFTGDILEAGLTYTYNENNSTAQVTGYIGTVENLIIPEVIEKDGKEYRVTSMVDKVFSGNTSLRSVEIAGSVETISTYAFSQCVNLEEVILKEGVKAIASCAFNKNTKLKKVSIPSTLQNISSNSIFADSPALETLDIAEGTTIIGYSFLSACIGVKSISIPDSVTTINDYAFSMTNIEEITIPKNVKTMQNYIFRADTSLKKIVFKGNKVPTFTKNTFNTIPEETVIIVPAGTKAAYTAALTAVGYKGAVEEAAAIDFTYSVTGNSAVITGYTGEMEIAEIPSSVEIEGQIYSVEAIAAGAFKNSPYLKQIILSDTIKNIGAEAFVGSLNVKNIDFTALSSVPTVEKNAFNGIPESAVAKVPTKSVAEFKKAIEAGNFKGSIEGLTRYEIVDGRAVLSAYEEDNAEVTIPSQVEINGSTYEVTGMRAGVFYNNTKIINVTLPETITSISDSAFEGAANLKSVKFSEKLNSIGEKAFYGCKNLTEIKSNGKTNTLPETLKTIGARAFYQNSSLANLTIPKSVNRIEDYAFYGCTALTSFELPDQLTYIGAYAFSQDKGITQLDLPKSLEYIGEYAFEKTGITKIVIPEKVTELRDNLFDTSALKEITLPKNLKSIGKSVFNRTGLEAIELPESVEYIGDRAFFSTQLTEIKIPDKVQGISAYLFTNCTKLSKVEMGQNVKSIGNFAFQHCTSLADKTIFNYITNIGSYAFSDTGYEDLVIPANVTTMERSIFANSLKLKEVKFENSITVLPHSTFQGCKALETVVLPETLEEVGAYAVNNATALKKLVIPQHVKEIGPGAFAGLTSLETIIFKAPKLAVLAVSPFTKVPATVVAVVPGGSKESYQGILTSRDFPGTIQAQILDLQLNETDMSLIKNTTKQLSVPNPADDVEDKTLTWESSDNRIATVSATGLVQAVSAGKATITVSASNGVTASATIYVTDSVVEAEKITFSDKEVTLEEGSSVKVTGTVTPDNTTNKQISWSSSEPTVATVDADGKIEAIAHGTAVITAKTSNGKTEEVKVTVKSKKLADGIYRVPVSLLNENSGNASMANAALNPEAVIIVDGDKTNVYITWKGLVIGSISGHITQGWYFETKDNYENYKKSSNESLRKDFVINSYFEEAGKSYPAQSMLTVPTGSDNIYLQVYVDAMASAPYTRLIVDYTKAESITKVEAEAIEIEQQNIHLKEGETVKLSAVTNPKETTLATELTWESDNTEVAVVDEKTGVVTGKKDGITKIFVYTKGNLTAQTEVTVVSKAQEEANQTALQLVDEINALPDAANVHVSDIAQLKSNIQKISEKYAALNERAQALVVNISKLEPLKTRVAQLEKANALATALDKEIVELPKAEQITADNVTDVKEKVELLKGRYEVLEEEAKALVTKHELLTQTESAIAQVEKGISDAKEVDEKIQALPAADSVNFSNVSEVKVAVQKAREKYNELNAAYKKLVTKLTVLTQAENKVTQLMQELAYADAIKKQITALSDIEQITYANVKEKKQALESIKVSYQALKDSTKALVDNYSTIPSVEEKIKQVENAIQEGSNVIETINKVSAFDKNTTLDGWKEIVHAVEQIQEKYNQLDENGKGIARSKYEDLVAQIEKVNHETADVKILSGLKWYQQVAASKLGSKDAIYKLAEQKADEEKKELLSVVEINIQDLHDNTKISQLTGKAVVTIKIPENLKEYDKDSIIVLHYKEGKLIEELKGIDNGDGTVSFETDSFSTYAILATEKTEQPLENGNDENADTNTSDIAAVPADTSNVTAKGVETGDAQSYQLALMTAMLSLATLAGISFHMGRRKRKKQ